MTTVADLFTKYNCTNCQDDIQGIRVHCAECVNFDLCLQCFAAGAEIGSHLNNHAYQFMDTGTTILSVFRGKGAWTAREEIRLLDAIEQYGFGNWEDISKHIETKSAEDAKEEYVNKFVNGTIGRHTWSPAQSQRPSLVDHTSDDKGPLGAGALQRLPPLDITTEEAIQLGYMPNRDGFEREYDPSAEQLISQMTFNPDDSEADYLLKLAHVDMYTRRLRERCRRKRIVRDYQLVAQYFRNRNYAQNPGLSKEQKEFRDRFRVYSQFYTANEYERLLNSLEREKELRIRLSELCRYRYNGLTRIDECRHFEQHAAMAQHRSTENYGHGKTDNMQHSSGSHRPGSSLHSPQLSSRIKLETLSAVENSNLTSPRNMPHTGDQTSYGASLPNKNYLDSCRGLLAPTTTTTMPTPMNAATALNSLQQPQQHPSSKLNVPSHAHLTPNQTVLQSQPPPLQHLYNKANIQLNHNNLSVNPMPAVVEKPTQNQQENLLANPNANSLNELKPALLSGLHPQHLQQQGMSSILRTQLDEVKHLVQPLGNNLLSSSEQQLCKVFNLNPTSYLSLKTLLLSGAPVATNNLSPLENSLRKYFVKVGWLSH